MTGSIQNGLHPDAEQLNAFVEQALGDGERNEMLNHLARCGRCRQVVALARVAAQQEEFEQFAAVAAAAPRAAVRPDAWWKRWRPVWVPAAAAAAFAVATFSVYLEHRNPMSSTAERSQNRAASPVSAAQPAELAESAPPASPKAGAQANSRKARHPEATAGTPQLGSGIEPSHVPQSLPAPAQPLPAPLHAASIDLAQNPALQEFVPGGNPANYRPSASAQLDAEKKQQNLGKQQLQSDAIHAGMFAGRASAAAKSQSASTIALGSANNPVPVTTERAALRPIPAVSFGTFGAPSLRAPAPFLLPNGLHSVSIASSDDRRIALDEAGALFLSIDGGKTWASVSTQWTGRAVLLRRAAVRPLQQESLPAPDEGSRQAAPQFELVNDQGQVWTSTDGMNWKAQ